MYIVRMFLISWFVTVVTEEAAALIMGCRKRHDFLTVLWVNTLTNPAAVGIRILSNRTVPEAWVRTVIIILVEIAVVLVEWRLFRRFLRGKRNCFLFSVILNAASYGMGLLIPFIMSAVL